jgi:fructose-bisphosphate aldolase class 1
VSIRERIRESIISGIILYDETIRQSSKDGTPFVKVITGAGIIPGIKVDSGAQDMAGHPEEKITEGLDGLRARLAEYSQMGARFTKWRAVITSSDGIPSRGYIEANAQPLARYAALRQEAGLVPPSSSLKRSWTASIPWRGAWKGRQANAAAAQQALDHRARCNSAARLGRYRTEMENNVDWRARSAKVVT